MKMKNPVYFIKATREDSAEILSKKTDRVFAELGLDESIAKENLVALKIHFGETGNKGYIRPSWLKHTIQRIKQKTSRVYITDTNALYTGKRSNAPEHLQLAVGHGFSLSKLHIPVIIADGLIGRDEEEIVVDLPRIKKAKLASAFMNTDYLVCLSHLTGHLLSGFAGTLKNLGMGCASRAGKLDQHSEVHPWINSDTCTNCAICMEYCPVDAIEQGAGSAVIIDEKCIGCGECLVVCTAGAVKMRWDQDVIRVQEKIAEYAFSIGRLFEGKRACLNFLLNVTKNCDCMAKEEPAVVEDVGIVCSEDPVAVDKASVDLIHHSCGKDLFREIHKVDWSVQLQHAQEVGLGNMSYDLIELML
jgi:hypothetical protein